MKKWFKFFFRCPLGDPQKVESLYFDKKIAAMRQWNSMADSDKAEVSKCDKPNDPGTASRRVGVLRKLLTFCELSLIMNE